MKLEKAIKSRRSIRKFKNKSVSKKKLNKILESARLCQSAKNRQPWRFYICTKKEKDTIADLMREAYENLDSERRKCNSTKETASAVNQCDIFILIFRNGEIDWNTSDLVSIGAAIENMCLTATSLGLGSLWIRDTCYAEREIAKFVNRQELELVSSLAIGYANEKPHKRPRKQLKDLIIS